MAHTKSRLNPAVCRELILFAIPLILSAVLQQLYNWADAFILGNAVGELALGAIGGTGTITSFFVLTMTGFSVGIGVLAGQKHGEGDTAFISDTLSVFSLLMGAAYLLLALLGLAGCDAILRLLGTPTEIFSMSREYLSVIMLGMPFLAVYNVVSAVLRGVGDSRAPFYAVLVSSVFNVLLDLLMVVHFRLGVRGAAAATVVSQILMTVFILGYLHVKHGELHLVPSASSFRREVLKSGFALSLPPMLQSCITSAGNLVLQNFMNSFGTATVIAITASYRVDTLTMLPLVNTASAIATLTAQSYGAGNRRKLKEVRTAGLAVMFVVSLLMTILVIPFGAKFVALFGAGEEAVAIAQAFFVRLASFYVAFGFYSAIRGTLEGVGDMALSSIIGVSMLAVRIFFSYLLRPFFGNMVIAYAEAIAWMISCGVYLARMRHVMRKIA